MGRKPVEKPTEELVEEVVEKPTEENKFFKVVIKPQKGFSEFNGERFGMLFSNGIGRTDNEYTAMRLKAKGYEVSEIEE